MNPGVDAVDVAAGADVLVVAGADVDAPKLNAGAADVVAPNAGALVAGAELDWPNENPEDAAGAELAAVEVTGDALADEVPNENAGALLSAVWPKPLLGFAAGAGVLAVDPNEKPVAGVSAGFDSAGFAAGVPKLNEGAAASLGFSVVVELLDPPKENEGVDVEAALASFAGG